MHPDSTHIKICCIQSAAEAKLAIEAGASAVGLVGKMPSGPGVIPNEKIHEIAKSLPPPIAGFLLTSETDAESILEHHQQTQTNVIQLVDEVEVKTYETIRRKASYLKIVQVVHVIGEHSVKYAKEVSAYVDALLLDSGNPNAEIKELGGTGRTHNWELSKQIRKTVSVPVFLAGGLNPGNVKKAIEQVNPFGVDICSGVRTNGNLDPTKLKQFIRVVKNH